MAKFCIKKDHPEVLALSKELGLPVSIISSKVAVWMDTNEIYDRFPTSEELNIQPQQVNYSTKLADIVTKNIDKILSWEKQIKDKDVLYKKIQELGIPKEQINLLKDSKGETVSEKLTSFLANYSYTVEINTAKDKNFFDGDITKVKKFIHNGYTYIQGNNGNYNNNLQPVYSKELPNDFDGTIITKEEFDKAAEEFYSLNQAPTQYYSNLTVPGGTNYTENAIRIPGVVNVISANGGYHDNDFNQSRGDMAGWFRSDDKTKESTQQEEEYIEYDTEDGETFIPNIKQSYTGDTPTKTRRILEIQSFFQKVRDRKVLSKKLDIKEVGDKFISNGEEFTVTNIDTDSNLYELKITISNSEGKTATLRRSELEKRFDERGDNSSENQFLQLLNKDNNWVTFFVKSIIQDSAKKGYEKVLFPRLDTIIQIESQNRFKTYEEAEKYYKTPDWIKRNEEAKKKLDEAKALTEQSERFIEVSKHSKYDFKEWKNNAIQRAYEEWHSLQPTLLNTANFYEYELANRLDDIAGGNKNNRAKGIWALNQITDEYGNTWNEVDIQNLNEDQLIPKFSLKPTNTLNPLEQNEFKDNIEVGDVVSFEYWSGTTSQEISAKNVTITSIKNDRFHAVYDNGEDRSFKFTNILSNKTDTNISIGEQLNFAKNLKVGKDISLVINGENISGKVESKSSSGFYIDKNFYKYSDISSLPEKDKLSIKVDKLLEILNKQIDIFSKNAKTKLQLDRIANLELAKKELENYESAGDLLNFYKTISKQINIAKTLMTTMSDKSPEEALHSFMFINHYMSSFDILNDIEELLPDGEIKEVSKGLTKALSDAKRTFITESIDKLADILWNNFPKKLNEQMALAGQKPWSKERFVEELSNPSNDISQFDKFAVPLINSNDVLSGTIAQVLKNLYSKIEILSLKIEDKLSSLSKGISQDVISSFYYTKKEGDKNIRYFITKYDISKYWKDLATLKNKISSVRDKMNNLPKKSPERNKAYEEYKIIKKEIEDYQNKYGIKYTEEMMNTYMEKLRVNDPSKFEDYKKFYYTLDSQGTLRNIDDAGEVFYYKYKGNFYKPNKDKLISGEYTNLMNNLNEEEKALYNYLLEQYEEADRKLPYNKRLHGRVPVAHAKNIVKDTKAWFKNFWKDDDKTYLSYINGEKYRQLRVGFTTPIDDSLADTNILLSTFKFIHEASMYKAKNDYLGFTSTIQSVLKSNKATEKNEFNRRYEAVSKFINQVFYDEKKESNGPITKLLDGFGKFVAISRMSLSANAFTNTFVGNISNYLNSTSGRYFTQKNFIKGEKLFFELLATNRKKLFNILNSTGAIQGRFSKEFGDKLKDWKDEISIDKLMIAQDWGETQIQGSMVLALLDAYNIEIPEDGFFEDLDNDFRNTLNFVNKTTHGVYNDFDRLFAQDNVIFRMFLQFRKWVVPTFRARFSGLLDGEYRIDIESGGVHKGWYRTFGEVAYLYYKSFKETEGIIPFYNSLNTIQKEGVIRTLADGMAYTALTGLLLIAGAYDDDKDDLSTLDWEMLYQLTRLRGELAAYYSPDDISRLVNEPFAAYSTWKTILKIFKMMFGGEFTDTYDRDTSFAEKGDNKLLYQINKINPFFNVYEALNPEDQYENFQKVSR